MTLSRWFRVLGLLVAVACVRVAQQQALYGTGYAVGERVHRMHVQGTEVAWLQAEVDGMAAPASLAKASRERNLKLVARRELAPRPGDRVFVRMAAATEVED